MPLTRILQLSFCKGNEFNRYKKSHGSDQLGTLCGYVRYKQKKKMMERGAAGLYPLVWPDGEEYPRPAKMTATNFENAFELSRPCNNEEVSAARRALRDLANEGDKKAEEHMQEVADKVTRKASRASKDNTDTLHAKILALKEKLATADGDLRKEKDARKQVEQEVKARVSEIKVLNCDIGKLKTARDILQGKLEERSLSDSRTTGTTAPTPAPAPAPMPTTAGPSWEMLQQMQQQMTSLQQMVANSAQTHTPSSSDSKGKGKYSNSKGAKGVDPHGPQPHGFWGAESYY